MSMQKMGRPARDLEDDALKRELTQMWRTRESTIMGGSSHAIATHTRRMLELEQEYVARFPDLTKPQPGRTRRGSRAASGQHPNGR